MLLSPKQSYTYFSNNFRIKKTSAGWFTFKCPFCNELENREKMAVQFQYGITKCWICGYKDYIDRFVADYEGIDLKDAKQKLKECKASNVNLDVFEQSQATLVSQVDLPIGYKGILEGKNIVGDRARNYLEKRGFDLQELDRIGLGYCYHTQDDLKEEEDYFGYIIIPFKTRGKLVYFIGRDFFGNFLRYKNPPVTKFGVGKGDLLFNEDALNIYDEVFITEGWADAMTIGRMGTSTQGWSLSNKQKKKILKSSCERLVFLPDVGKDNTGVTFYEKAIVLAMEFIDHKEVKVLDLSLLAEFGKDANEIGKEQIMELHQKTDLLTLETATKILM